MLILTNCLTDTADEGCLNVVNSLVKRIKRADPSVSVISYERKSELTDTYLQLNKLLLNGPLILRLLKQKEPLLYMPFPSRKTAMALRVFLLSLWTRRRLRVLLVLKTPIGSLGRILLRLAGPEVLVLSADAADFYGEIVGRNRVRYIRTGVDTQRFVPVAPEQAAQLKARYGLDPNKKTVLHVGHLKQGRNLDQLLKIDPSYQILLVTSTLTKNEQDVLLEQRLRARPDLHIVTDYLPEIQQVYQLCDVYFFPVVQEGNCIDVPLSCLEAAACGKPVVTTVYGETKQFLGKPGWFFLDSLEKEEINSRLEEALTDSGTDIRHSVAEYDWNRGTACFLNK